MHKRYLWVDRRGADLHWPALGNLDISATGKGTLLYWVRKPRGNNYWGDDVIWKIHCSDTNYMRSRFGRSVLVCSNGVQRYWNIGDIENDGTGAWELHCHEWDFAAGWVKSWYNDALPSAPDLTGLSAPQGTAQYLQIGYPYSSPTLFANSDLHFHAVAIWDGHLSTAQISALWQRGYLDEIHPEDGTGNLTLLIRFNEGMNADIAGGDPTFTRGAATPLERYCLLEEGLRNKGVAIFPIGRPRHDGSEDDRKPLSAVCPLTLDSGQQQAAVSDSHETNYAKVTVQNFSNNGMAGAHFPNPPLPGTYRQLIHIPNENNVAGYEMGIGPVAYKHYPSASTGVFDAYGSGRKFSVVADAGNTPSSFKTNLSSRHPDSYWTGARLTFFSGNCRGYAAKVASFNSTTGFITLDVALPQTPAAGSVGFVSHYPRIIGQAEPLGELLYDYTMEANLWAHHDTSKHFVELEWLHSLNAKFLRYEKGRTAIIPGSGYNGGGHGLLYGKWYGYVDSPPTQLEFWLRKIELAGPQKYQVVRRALQAQDVSLADNFLVLARDVYGVGTDSVKVWRRSNLALVRERPVKQTNYQQVTADLTAVGTWRHTAVSSPFPIAYDEQSQKVTCAFVGKDEAGVSRLGYIIGQWNPTTGRILWTDEPAPPGKSNPVLDMATLRSDRESDAPTYEAPWLCNVLQAPDGTWSLLYGTRPDAVDGSQIYCLHGAADRWSFDFASQFAGPLVPMCGGVDSREPLTGHGWMPWMNMHAYWTVTENPYAQHQERRYLAYVGGKTIYNYGTEYSTSIRPLMGCAGADLRSLRPLPHGNSLTPLPGVNMTSFIATVLGQPDALAILYSDGTSSGVGLLTSEDGIHFQPLFKNYGTGEPLLAAQELPGESFHIKPAPPLRLGDRRIYYYTWDQWINFATIRYDGETSYQLPTGQTEGWVETTILEKPAEGWGELFVNVAPAGGEVKVEVRDPALEVPLVGWTRSDCDALSDGLQSRVTWQGTGFSDLTVQYLRLRFYLKRSNAQQPTPKLYGWKMSPLVVIPPQVSDLKVEGQIAPAGLRDPQPTFSWTFRDAEGRAQAGYQVQVASSEALLTAGTPDMWDSGVVLSSETGARYAGLPLSDLRTYFWRVRVCNTEGVWSEQW